MEGVNYNYIDVAQVIGKTFKNMRVTGNTPLLVPIHGEKIVFGISVVDV